MRRSFLFHQRMPTRNLALLILGLSALWLSLPCSLSLSQAQVPPITPSGLNTQVSDPIAFGGQTQYDITGGTRPNGGLNLFHSFGNFGVPTNNIANFLNTPVNGVLPATSNILGRVTGGSISNIFGTIQTTGFGNANLFLMNPAGFLFGPNATVHVGGMVAFTSADYLRLAELDTSNSGIFHADPAQVSILTNAPVAAFGFLGSNPGAIIVQGSEFSVRDEQSISLVGGNISIESGTPAGGTARRAQFSAPNGNIFLASARSPGELDAMTLESLPNVNGTSFSSLGSVSLAPGSNIDVSGTNTISIKGGQFVLSMNDAELTTAESPSASNTVSLNRGSSMVSSNSGANRGADIEIVAGTLQMDGAMILNNTLGFGGGAAGNIFVNANTVTLQNGGAMSAETSGAGHGGTIDVVATESLSLKDASSISSNSNSLLGNAGNAGVIRLSAPVIDVQTALVSASTIGPGNAGNIVMEANRLNLKASETGQLQEQGADIFTRTTGPGQAGNIAIRGRNGPESQAEIVMISDFSRILSESALGESAVQGDGGNISIQTNKLTLSQNSRLSTASQTSTGNAGDLTIVASDDVRISSHSKLSSEAIEFASGDGGSITISAPTVLVESGGIISTNTDYIGDAGKIQIKANSLQLKTGGHISSSSVINQGAPDFIPTGSAGIITIQKNSASPAQSVLIDGPGSGIFTDTQGTGNGGNIFVNANSVTLTNGATVSATSKGQIDNPGDAGNIDITATNGFTMQNSTVTTEARQRASGGNIEVTTAPSATVLLENSRISASVPDGRGGGGNVTIDPQSVILQNSQILAQAAQGQGGAITITTNLFLPDANSIVNADSGSGLNGTVTIQSPNAPASGKIQPLGNQPLEATALLNQRCAALAGGEFSSFTVSGRDSLPTEPGSWLASPLVAFGAGEALGVRGEGMTLGASFAGETAFLSLRQIAPAGFLTQAFAENWSTGCQS